MLDITQLPDDFIVKGLIDRGIDEMNARAMVCFNRSAIERRYSAEQDELRFVHYTHSSTALKIAESNSIWLRNTRLMNDWSEVLHGIETVSNFLDSPDGLELLELLENLDPGISKKVRDYFSGWSPDIEHETYVFCLSEHGEVSPKVDGIYEEDQYGRLSMWRAYGYPNGVAVVINAKPLYSISDALGAYSYPVNYFSQDEGQSYLKRGSSKVHKTNGFSEIIKSGGFVFICV